MNFSLGKSWKAPKPKTAECGGGGLAGDRAAKERVGRVGVCVCVCNIHGMPCASHASCTNVDRMALSITLWSCVCVCACVCCQAVLLLAACAV